MATKNSASYSPTTTCSRSSIIFIIIPPSLFSLTLLFDPIFPSHFSMSSCMCLSPSPSASARENSIRRNKLIILVSLLFIVICVFIIVGVSRIVEIGSVPFFIIIIAGSMVFMCFFFALVALAKSTTAATISTYHAALTVHDNTLYNDDNPLPQVPVFYFLETIHREDEEDEKIVPDDGYWTNQIIRTESQKDVCAICLCDLDSINTGVSNCCKRRLHVKCAQKYFNVVQRVQCPLCRHTTTPPTTGENSLISSSSTTPPV